MKAIMQDTYGATDVLELRDIDRPDPGEGEVLVRVRAAGVDMGAWHIMTGRPYLIRLLGFGFRAPKVRVRGSEVAGVVESVGPGVTGFRPGDEVYGTSDGSFAEYAIAREGKIAPKPAGLTFEQAAAVPVSGSAALLALRDRVRAGTRVLVIGAGGGVGSYAVQIAKSLGAKVTGVCSTSKVDLVRSLGADDVVDYMRDPLTGTYDLVLDIAGNRKLSHLRRLLTPKGTLVLVGGETEGPVLGGYDRTIRALLLSPFVGQKLTGLVSTENAEHLHALTKLIDEGKVVPAVDRTFPLVEALEAIRYLVEGRARGKVVVTG